MKRLLEILSFHLNPDNWRVITGKPMNWMINNPTDGIKDILPSMKTDIILGSKISITGLLLILSSLIYFIKK